MLLASADLKFHLPFATVHQVAETLESALAQLATAAE
jgi:hypothetical protein